MSTIAVSTQTPVLTLSRTTLDFGKTSPGDERFLIIKIGQQLATTPITLSVSAPAYFQIAVGVTQLNFGPSLTFTPEPGGTYVHIRYTPDQKGRHAGSFLVQSSYETKEIAMTGQTGGLSLVPWSGPTNQLAFRLPTPSTVAPRWSRWASLVIAIVMGGVLIKNFSNHNGLRSSLYKQEKAIPAKSSVALNPSLVKHLSVSDNQLAARSAQQPVSTAKKSRPDVGSPSAEQLPKASSRKQAIVQPKNRRRPQGVSDRKLQRLATARTPALDESDLERTLNKAGDY